MPPKEKTEGLFFITPEGLKIEAGAISALTPNWTFQNEVFSLGETKKQHAEQNAAREKLKQLLAKPVVNGNLEIKRVIFNDPVTIVFWSDGSKTVVRCQPGDTYSKETGLAMAIVKRACGNFSNYNKIFKKWVKDDE